MAWPFGHWLARKKTGKSEQRDHGESHVYGHVGLGRKDKIFVEVYQSHWKVLTVGEALNSPADKMIQPVAVGHLYCQLLQK